MSEQQSDLDKLVININQNFQGVFNSILSALPPSRQLSLAQTKLEEAWMWFDNAYRMHKVLAAQEAQQNAQTEQKEEAVDGDAETEEKVDAA